MYKEIFIKDLNKGKVAVSGTIISKNNDNIVIDDKTGIVNVNVENNFKENDYVRIYGVFLGDFLKGEVIQKLEGDIELYKRVKELLY